MRTGTFFNFVHTAEIYKKVTTINPAGQKLSSYELEQTIPVIAQSRTQQYSGGALVRTTPYQDYISRIEIIVPSMYADVIKLSSRVANIKDRKNNIVDEGPFEIILVHPKFGFGGKKHHLMAQLRYVIEQS